MRRCSVREINRNGGVVEMDKNIVNFGEIEMLPCTTKTYTGYIRLLHRDGRGVMVRSNELDLLIENFFDHVFSRG